MALVQQNWLNSPKTPDMSLLLPDAVGRIFDGTLTFVSGILGTKSYEGEASDSRMASGV